MMRLKRSERQRLSDIVREEIQQAGTRIEERLSQLEVQSGANVGDSHDKIRRFYEDLTAQTWTAADEECLKALDAMKESEIADMMRQAYRLSPVLPIPSFASLVNVIRKGTAEFQHDAAAGSSFAANSSAERERLANILNDKLNEAAKKIASRMRMDETQARIVKEQLEIAEGQIISRFTPLV